MRKRRISFAIKVRSTIVEAMYPARSVIVVMTLDLYFGPFAVGQSCSDRRLIAAAGVADRDNHHSTFRWPSGTPRTCGLFTPAPTIRVSVYGFVLDLRELLHQLCYADHFTMIGDDLN